MPSPQRSALPMTAAGLSEDLRLAREAGGIEVATADRLQATLQMFGVTDVDDQETALLHARAVLATHVRRTCQEVTVKAVDACAVAAATSLAGSLLRHEGPQQKVASIRRAAMANAGCQLTQDGLRKREDLLIEQAAAAVYEDLVQRRRTRGPRTVEEAVRHAGPMMEIAHTELHDGLPMLYSVAPNPDQRRRDSFTWDTLVTIALVMDSLGKIIELHVHPGNNSNVDFLFADLARHAFLVTLPEHQDKLLLHKIMRSLKHPSPESLVLAIEAEPRGDAFLRRWREWLTSCHPTCAYERAETTRLSCLPHQLTAILHEFCLNYQDLVNGQLEAFLDEDLRLWDVEG